MLPYPPLAPLPHPLPSRRSAAAIPARDGEPPGWPLERDGSLVERSTRRRSALKSNSGRQSLGRRRTSNSGDGEGAERWRWRWLGRTRTPSGRTPSGPPPPARPTQLEAAETAILYALMERDMMVLAEHSAVAINAGTVARQVLECLPEGGADSHVSYTQDCYIFHTKRTDSITNDIAGSQQEQADGGQEAA